MAGGTQRISAVNKPCILLIVISGIERFAFKGVASNLVTYLTDVVKMSNSSAARMVNSWVGFTYLIPLLVAPFTDSCKDRYTIIQAFSFIYALGLALLSSTSLTWPLGVMNMKKTRSFSFLCWSLFMISLGQGGYNPSLQAFGADQLENDEEHPSSKIENNCNTRRLFFQWWYFGVCVGCLLGVSIMSYIQDTFGWGLGFAIPAISLVTSISFFTCGKRSYRKTNNSNSNSSINVDRKMVIKKIQAFKATFSWIMRGRNGSNKDELELQGKQVTNEDEESLTGSNNKNNYKKDMYLYRIGSAIIPLLPIWAILLMFAVIFQQPATFFTKQGMTMKRNIGNNFKIPPAALQSAITISIVLLMPLYDMLFLPITRAITKTEKGISVLQRIGIGMFLSIIAMVIAALTERKRLNLARNLSFSETVPMTIFWLLPQYVLLGVSDIFTVVGMQEFFFSEVPQSMRTLGLALNTSVFGVGSFLSALFISLIEYFTRSSGGKSWFSDDMRESRLDNYYWLLSISSGVSLAMFVTYSAFYRSSHDVNG